MRLIRAVLCACVLSLTLAAQQAPSSAVVSGPAAERIDRYLSGLVPYGFSGAVLVATADADGGWSRGGRVVLRKGYGFADREGSLPYTPDMVSTIGSITKQFTGAAIVKLESQGKLKTDEPISKYLPGVPTDKAGITIHQLLTHTAGFAGDLGGGDEQPIERDALVARVLAAPLASRPGEQFEYSNEGYSLAAAIVERVSGQGYEQFLREHLFLPSGMSDTGYQLPAWPLSRLPIGYGPEGDAWGRVYRRGWLPDGPGWWLRGNGGIHSSLDDMYRWHLALKAASVLPADALKRYLTGYVPAMPDELYAYGWGVRKTRRGTTVISHNGGNGVFAADFHRYVDEDVVIIAMTNQPSISAPQLTPRQLQSLYFDDAPVVMPPTPVATTPAQREALAGTYRTERGDITIRATVDGLTADSEDPTLFGTFGTLTPAGGRFADLEQRTIAIIDAGAKGNFDPLIDAFAFEDAAMPARVRANQTRYWQEWRQAQGDFTRARVLGTALGQGDPEVIVLLEFARGRMLLQYAWGPRRLLGWRDVVPEPVSLTPESANRWAHYSYRLPDLIVFSFDADQRLTMATPAGTFTGRRESPGVPVPTPGRRR
jgi:CubicO group peptidase (beta-lactamase class C family)